MKNWKDCRNSGPWAFEKQANKFGYINNPRWRDLVTGEQQGDSVVWNSNQNPMSAGNSVKHSPCGYWYKGLVTEPKPEPESGLFAYFGTSVSPGIVVKIRLSDLTRVGALILNSGENSLISAVIDQPNGFAYFGTNTDPGIVVKVRLSDFTRVGALTLNSKEQDLISAVIDQPNGFAYFGTNTGPGRVVKVRLSDLTKVGALILDWEEQYLVDAVIDQPDGFAYFGTNTSPGKIIKVDLSDFIVDKTKKEIKKW